jgi:3-oxoacyl-[acyl-carrier protein] reductase
VEQVDGSTWLDGTVAAVVQAVHPAGAELALGLADLGAAVGEVAEVDHGIDAHLAAVVAEHGPLDLAVVPVVPVAEPVRAELADLDLAGWVAACEAPLARVRLGLAGARRAFGDRGGCIVVVGPTAAITGEAGLVGYTAAAEGAHALVKACARSWGGDGVTVHWVQTTTTLLTGAGPGASVALWDESLGREPTLRGDVARAIAGLASPAMAFVTGSTLSVDGGMVLHG